MVSIPLPWDLEHESEFSGCEQQSRRLKKEGQSGEKKGELGHRDCSLRCPESLGEADGRSPPVLPLEPGHLPGPALLTVVDNSDAKETLCSGLSSGAHLLAWGGQGILNDGLITLHPSFQKEIRTLLLKGRCGE